MGCVEVRSQTDDSKFLSPTPLLKDTVGHTHNYSDIPGCYGYVMKLEPKRSTCSETRLVVPPFLGVLGKGTMNITLQVTHVVVA